MPQALVRRVSSLRLIVREFQDGGHYRLSQQWNQTYFVGVPLYFTSNLVYITTQNICQDRLLKVTRSHLLIEGKRLGRMTRWKQSTHRDTFANCQYEISAGRTKLDSSESWVMLSLHYGHLHLLSEQFLARRRKKATRVCTPLGGRSNNGEAKYPMWCSSKRQDQSSDAFDTISNKRNPDRKTLTTIHGPQERLPMEGLPVSARYVG